MRLQEAVPLACVPSSGVLLAHSDESQMRVVSCHTEGHMVRGKGDFKPSANKELSPSVQQPVRTESYHQPCK